MSKDSHTSLLLTGSTGFLGTALVRRLIDNAHFKLVAAVRREIASQASGYQTILVGDLDANTDWISSLSGIEVVIHTAARVHVMNDSVNDPLSEFRRINVEGTLNLAQQAVAAGVKRFIFISSIKVNGGSTVPGKPFTADDRPDPVDPYGVSKWESEDGLCKLAKETGMEVVIIRPPLVYGPGVKANFQSMLCWISRGVPLPLGAIQNKRSLLALDNLVDLIFTCIEHSAAANQIFLASDGEDISTTELLQRVGDALGRPAKLVSVPVGFINSAAKLLGKHDISQRLLGSLQVDITKTRDLLNWQPIVSMDEALQRTAQAFLQKQ